MASKPDEKAELTSLVERARAGEEAAFDALARAVLPRLRRWALVLTGDPDDADDAVQRTLVLTYRNLEGFRDRARFTTWLYRILSNVVADERRKRNRTKEARDIMERESAMRVSQSRDPAEILADQESRRLVERFFQDLPGRQRAVFDLVDLQGYGPAEAAEMLEISGSTARVHLHRARAAIRTAILEGHPELAREMTT